MKRRRLRYEFVSDDGQFLGEQEWRGRHWRVGDTIEIPGRPEGVAQRWIAIDVSGLRVTFGRAPGEDEAPG